LLKEQLELLRGKIFYVDLRGGNRMTKFGSKWNLEVRKIANQCVDWKFIELVQKSENKIITEDEEEKLQELGIKIKDAYSMWYISDMIRKVDQALADNRQYMARVAIISTYEAISKESYWKNTFNNDLSSDEAKNIKELENALGELKVMS
jgi:alanine dehydrogenase